MGSFQRISAGLWCPIRAMGEIAEDFPASQSDSEASSSSVELGEGGGAGAGTSRCRWAGCGRWFDHLDLLAAHVTRVHATCGQGGLFYCGWEGCARGDRGFNARYKMLVHVRTHTNEKPHHCFKCDKSFSRAENLKIHARSHTGERPYICPVPGCGKAYSNSSDRFKHTRTHSVDKPYTCKVPGCPKRYTDPSSLRKHVKTYRHFQGTSQLPDETSSLLTDAQVEKHARTSASENEDESMEVGQSRPSEQLMASEAHNIPKDLVEEHELIPHEETSVTQNTKYYNLDQMYSHWPQPQYGLFCSWLSLWRQPLSQPPTRETQEQDLPLDLTVHRPTATT